MNENQPVEKKKNLSPPRGGPREKKRGGPYPFELRLRAVKLHLEEGWMEPLPERRRILVGPRFFERVTPNQMWQSDIFTFRLGGRSAFLIAFMDDCSRFLTGVDLFRSPTAENVIEVFRVASGELE